MPVRVGIANKSGVPFIAQRVPGTNRAGTMEIFAQWYNDAGRLVFEASVPLPYDVIPGDDYAMNLRIPTPAEIGPHNLSLFGATSIAPHLP